MHLDLHRQFSISPTPARIHPHAKRRFWLYGSALFVLAGLFLWNAAQLGSVDTVNAASLSSDQAAIAAAQRAAVQQWSMGFTELLRKAASLVDTPKRATAILMLEEAVRRNPENRDAALQLGYAYLKDGDLEKARISLEHARSLDPVYPATYQLLHSVYELTGNKQQAADAAARAQDFARVPDLTK